MTIDFVFPIIGIVLLFAGRKVFWLLIGAIGFLIGMEIGSYFFDSESHLTGMAIAILFGLVGIVLAIFIQKIAVGLAGFALGSLLTMEVLQRFSQHDSGMPWVAMLIGGIVGAIVLSIVFGGILIGLSSMVGAYLIVDPLAVDRQVQLLLWLGLFILGVIVQSKLSGKKKPEEAAVKT